ncbi:MAG TPA: cysteine desulfurase family protein [Bacillota bacterium]|nr:cysteine desulfurase family protein [Bacillota bacterium]
MIYLDNSATTQPDPSVLESFQKVSRAYFANSSSIHRFGGETEKLLLEAKSQVAHILNVEQDEVIFTSGGTEGNNLAIKGIAFEHMNRGKHIITTKVEHPSVFEACRSLESFGFDITYLPVNQDGIVSVEDVAEAIREDTILISIMHVNNEMGAIQPIESIGEIAKQHPKLFFHVDDVQGVGKVPLHLSNSGIDLCTMSGHKINGLKGTGVLYVKKGTALFPLFHGGNQEQGIRPGTENLAGAVAMAKALRLIKAREANDLPSLQDKQKRLIKGLDKIPNVCVNTPARSAPHIVNFSVPGFKPEVLIHMLGEKDIFVSTKSACSSKETDASRILLACGHHKERASSALRISLSYDTTDEDIAIFLKQVEQSIQQLKEVME